MSVIKTWKCDGCGAISREEKPRWYVVEVWPVRAPRRELFGPQRETVRRHICSIECVDTCMTSAREEIEALEVEA